MDWDSLGPISLALTAIGGVIGGAVKWTDSVKQRRRSQMIEALRFRLEAEKAERAEAERERDLARQAYRYASTVARSYERQLIAAGITPDPEWEEPDV